MEIEDFKKIVVLVEDKEGNAYQVLATHREKQIALYFLKPERELKIAPINPIEIKLKQ